MPPAEKAAILRKLAGGFDKIGRFAVQQFITTDGFKFLLPDNEWVAFRASGTEPVIRCYLEAKSAAHLKKLKSACRKILTGK
jgi:phosphomannomutase